MQLFSGCMQLHAALLKRPNQPSWGWNGVIAIYLSVCRAHPAELCLTGYLPIYLCVVCPSNGTLCGPLDGTLCDCSAKDMGDGITAANHEDIRQFNHWA